jgi:hypothetical protein
MRRDVLNGAQLYKRSRRQCGNLFLWKRMAFCFNHPRDPNAKPRSQKVGSLKDFEINGVLEKKLLRNG